MDHPPDVRSFLKTTVALVAGTRERIVRIEAKSDVRLSLVADTNEWKSRMARPRIDTMVSAFLRAIELGCFTGAETLAPTVLATMERVDPPLAFQGWEVSLPALPEGAFDALVRMAGFAAMNGSGLHALTIEEKAPPELPRITQSGLTPLRAPDPPFAVEFHLREDEKKQLGLMFTFVQDPQGPTVVAVRALLEGWAQVLSFGGFPPARSLPWSTGFLADVSGHLPEEIVATVEFFSGKKEAWDALLRGLCGVHARQPVERVEIG